MSRGREGGGGFADPWIFTPWCSFPWRGPDRRRLGPYGVCCRHATSFAIECDSPCPGRLSGPLEGYHAGCRSGPLVMVLLGLDSRQSVGHSPCCPPVGEGGTSLAWLSLWVPQAESIPSGAGRQVTLFLLPGGAVRETPCPNLPGRRLGQSRVSDRKALRSGCVLAARVPWCPTGGGRCSYVERRSIPSQGSQREAEERAVEMALRVVPGACVRDAVGAASKKEKGIY